MKIPQTKSSLDPKLATGLVSSFSYEPPSAGNLGVMAHTLSSDYSPTSVEFVIISYTGAGIIVLFRQLGIKARRWQRLPCPK